MYIYIYIHVCMFICIYKHTHIYVTSSACQNPNTLRSRSVWCCLKRLMAPKHKKDDAQTPNGAAEMIFVQPFGFIQLSSFSWLYSLTGLAASFICLASSNLRPVSNCSVMIVFTFLLVQLASYELQSGTLVKYGTTISRRKLGPGQGCRCSACRLVTTLSLASATATH